MKKIILSILLLKGCVSFGQIKDTIPKRFTDTTKMHLSLVDVQQYVNLIKSQITLQEAEDFWKVFNYIVATKQKEYETSANKK